MGLVIFSLSAVERHRLAHALERLRVAIFDHEHPGHQPLRRRRDDDRVGLSGSLHTGRNVRRVAKDFAAGGDHYRPGMHPDPEREARTAAAGECASRKDRRSADASPTTWQAACASSKPDPRGLIGGFDRLRIACLHGDAQRQIVAAQIQNSRQVLMRAAREAGDEPALTMARRVPPIRAFAQAAWLPGSAGTAGR